MRRRRPDEEQEALHKPFNIPLLAGFPKEPDEVSGGRSPFSPQAKIQSGFLVWRETAH
jgi:hypothetical protein